MQNIEPNNTNTHSETSFMVTAVSWNILLHV